MALYALLLIFLVLVLLNDRLIRVIHLPGFFTFFQILAFLRCCFTLFQWVAFIRFHLGDLDLRFIVFHLYCVVGFNSHNFDFFTSRLLWWTLFDWGHWPWLSFDQRTRLVELHRHSLRLYCLCFLDWWGDAATLWMLAYFCLIALIRLRVMRMRKW